MNKAQVIYVAAILEGEGSFILHPEKGTTNKFSLRVVCSMTDQDIIERLFSFTKIGSIISKTPVEQHKPMWVWHVSYREDVVWLLEKILPYMGIRRTEKINELLEYHKVNPPRRRSYIHGTVAYYARGCRCGECRREGNRYYRERYRIKKGIV